MLGVSCQKKEERQQAFFELMDNTEIGIDFKNMLAYTEDFNIYLYKSFYNGAGVGLGDFNRDGLQDVFLCGNQTDNQLYLNQGSFKFRDVTAIAGVGSSGSWSTGVSIVDINADGWLDIYVCKSGNPESENRRNELFINTGQLNTEGIPIFKEKAAQWGINDLGFSVQATFFDYDRDGDLDMYLLNNSITPSEIILDAKKGLRQIYDPLGGNKLYQNRGNTFVDVTREAGIYGSSIGFGLGASVGDLNRDGWPDIYIANDFFERDYLYYNNKDGTFKEDLEHSLTEISQGAMGVDIADLTNDGWPEIFVTEMLPKGNKRLKTKVLFDGWDTYSLRLKNGYYRQFPRNTLQLNQGPAPNRGEIFFSEVSRLTETAASEWSWGVHMLDLDNDTDKEIYVTNGIVKDLLDQDYIDFYNNADQLRKMYQEKGAVIKELVDKIPSERVANHLYEQRGILKFDEVAKAWGLDTPAFSTGAAFGDLDNDGDLDLVVNNLNDKPFIYLNTIDGANNYFSLKLIEDSQNRDGIGVQVSLYIKGTLHYQELLPTRGTMSTSDNRLHFGLGNNEKIDSLIVLWPSGKRSKLFDVKANQFLTLNKAQSSLETPQEESRLIIPQFLVKKGVGASINYVHREDEYIDFNRDKLRYSSIAEEGPRVAVGDVNGDGRDDFYIGGASGSAGVLYLATPKGIFQQNQIPSSASDALAEDTDAVFVDVDNDGDLDLLVASGGYKFPSSSFALANRIYLNDGKGNFEKSAQTLPQGKLFDTSCIIPADYDNDGDQDLFVGGRTEPLSYGVPTNSYLLVNDGKGNFKDETVALAPALQNLGMVTDAVWLDYDRDGDQDLVIVGEWMPVTLLRNDNGQFTAISDVAGLDHTHGLWHTITASDLDGDGYEDLIAGNLGLNTFLKAAPNAPLRMFVNDFDGNSQIDHILATYENGKLYPLSTKKEMTAQLPYLLKKYLKYEDYADQTIGDIFTKEQLANSIQLTVEQTASMVFWNNEGTFEGVELPLAAQLSCVYAILPVDITDDGKEELLLGGNLFKAKPQIGIYAGSMGQVITIKDERELKCLSHRESGFFVDGQVRDIKTLGSEKDIIIVTRSNDSIAIFEKSK